jgi:hypothetical protein
VNEPEHNWLANGSRVLRQQHSRLKQKVIHMSNVTEQGQEDNNAFQKFSVGEPGQSANTTGESRVDYEKFRVDPASPVLTSTPVSTQILITKPRPNWVFQTHVNALWSFIAWILKVGFGDYYVIAPELRYHLVGIAHKMILIPCITTMGKIFLWPIRLPNAKGHLDSCNKTALDAAVQGRGVWIKIAYSDELENYAVDVMHTHVAEPQWPVDITFEKILDLAFPPCLIESLDHPAVIAAYNEDRTKMR